MPHLWFLSYSRPKVLAFKVHSQSCSYVPLLSQSLECCLRTHDLAFPYQAQKVSTTGGSAQGVFERKLLRVLLLGPLSLESIDSMISRAHTIAELTDGADVAIVFLLLSDDGSSVAQEAKETHIRAADDVYSTLQFR